MSGLYIQPKNTMPVIESLWAFLSVDPRDGNEGVIGMMTPTGWMPLIAADAVRLAELIPLAEKTAAESGNKVRLVKFETRKVIREFGK